ncbi:MAG TPA: ParB N-terminal domain-containing protein, partial [Tissierellaceae bacterium]|nr:ParB N-terminal domain-containing protein [Tissierellaceae bacterium]
MNKLKIEYMNIEKLIPYINNPRLNDGAVDKVASSIKNFGFKNPIIIDKDNEIIAGHTRLKAARKLGLDEVPTIKVEDLTDNQIKAFRIADNKTSEFAEWDFGLLEIELEGLDDEFTGFDIKELDDMFPDDTEVIEDEFDGEPPENPISKRGDIWQLGRHRLMCGDSTSINDVEKLMNGNKADMVFTDPPYGMNAVSKSGVLSKKYKTDIIGDDDNSIAIKAFELCQRLFKTSKQVWWGANYYTECLPSSECWIVWDKNNGQSDQTDCELAWANFRSVVRQ